MHRDPRLQVRWAPFATRVANARRLFRHLSPSIALKFNGVNLQESTFTNVNLAGVRFRDVNLASATIEDANLTGMSINEALVTELIGVNRVHDSLSRSAGSPDANTGQTCV